MKQVIVVGGGIAGSAAALRAAQYGMATAWILGGKQDKKASRGQWVFNVDNMIGIHDGIVRAKVQKLLKRAGHAEAAAAVAEAPHLPISTRDIVQNVEERIAAQFGEFVTSQAKHAVRAFRRDGHFGVELDDGTEVLGEALVVATGVMDRQPNVKKAGKKGDLLDDIRWVLPFANQETLLYCIRCEGHLVRGSEVSVIGSSETTAQIGMMLHERYGVRVTLLTNGEELTASDKTRTLLGAYEIGVETARIVDVQEPPKAEGERRIKGSQLQGFELEDGTFVASSFGFVSLGLHRVYNDLAIQLGAELADEGKPETERHIFVDVVSETSVPGLFVVGDASARRTPGPKMKQIYTAQEYAVRAVDTVERRGRTRRRDAILAAAAG